MTQNKLITDDIKFIIRLDIYKYIEIYVVMSPKRRCGLRLDYKAP